MAKKLVPEYQISLSKDGVGKSSTLANIYESVKDGEKSVYKKISELKTKASNNDVSMLDMTRNFFRKNIDEIVSGNVSFEKEISSSDYGLTAGWKLYNDIYGNATLDVDNLNVRKNLYATLLTYEKVNAIGGTLVLSSAWGTITRVTETGDGEDHRVQCYYKPEGVSAQIWMQDDQVKIQSGLDKFLMTYVTDAPSAVANDDGEYMFEIYHGGVSSEQIGETIPSEGIVAVQWGHRGVDNDSRKNIIMMSVNSEDGYPFIEQYKGVDSFDVTDKVISRISNDVYFGDAERGKYIWWNKENDGEFVIKGLLLADAAILGGFVFSPAFDSSGNAIPESEQYIRTNDSEANPAIIFRGDGSGHLAKENISWDEYGNITVTGEYKSGESGKRTVINPENGRILMYDDDGRLMCHIDDSYSDGEPAIILKRYSGSSTTPTTTTLCSSDIFLMFRNSDSKTIFTIQQNIDNKLLIASDIMPESSSDVGVGQWYNDGGVVKIRTS